MSEDITFLFGAGAECGANYNLPSGAEFTAMLLNTNENLNKHRKDFYGDELKAKYQLFTSTSKNVFIQTVCDNIEKLYDSKNDNNHNSNNEFILTKEQYDAFKFKIKGTQCSNDQKEEYNKIIDSFCKEVHKYFDTYNNKLRGYKDINEFYDKEQEYIDTREFKTVKFFLENAEFFSSLDSKFNLLREVNEDKISCKAKRVKDAYISLFLGLIDKLNYIEDKTWTFDNVIKTIGKKISYNYKKQVNTYYDVINSLLKNKNRNFNVHLATSNYTNCLSNEIENENQEIIYLHGKLNLFEDLKHLVIYDATKEEDLKLIIENKNYIIPFILIPSGVKPLICKEEIESFYNFYDKLNQSSKLCVLGYGFNSEDNHINSIISSWLREDPTHELIYFYYCGNEEAKISNKDLAKKYLWLEGRESQIKIKLINKDNSYTKFKEFCENLLSEKID